MPITQRYHTLDAALEQFDLLGGVAQMITRADLETWRDERKELLSMLEHVARTVVEHAIRDGEDCWHWCDCCGVNLPLTDADHKPGCAYVLARAILNKESEQ